MEKLAIVGAGGHAKVVLDILKEMNNYEIVGVTTNEISDKKDFCGYPILGDESILSDLIVNGVTHVAIGVGGFRNNYSRQHVYAKVKAIGFQIVSAVHPSAVISKTVVLGEGNVIFLGVCINTDAHIGNNVIIATGSTIDHETTIEDHVLVSAGVTVGANVLIQEGALLALGSKVVSRVKVGRNVLIGAGAVVVKDCLEEGTYLGIPATRIDG